MVSTCHTPRASLRAAFGGNVVPPILVVCPGEALAHQHLVHINPIRVAQTATKRP